MGAIRIQQLSTAHTLSCHLDGVLHSLGPNDKKHLK